MLTALANDISYDAVFSEQLKYYLTDRDAVLLVSSRMLVWGAVNIALELGVSDLVIGLTIVAIGTSLPELAASIMSALKAEHDIALGNIIGSNIANLSLVLGLTGAIWPLAVAARFIQREVPFMLLTSALVFPIVWDNQVSRLEGAVLLAILFIYLIRLL